MKPLQEIIATVFIFWLVLSTHKGVSASENERRLIKKLFKNYEPNERPVLRDNETVTVTFGLTISAIVDVDEKNQVLTTSVWVRQIWYNPMLSWNASEFDGLKTINVIPKKIWKPDIVLYGNADENIEFGGNLDRLTTRIVLRHDGRNTWLSPIQLKSECTIDVSSFPFDTQKCKLKFGSWTYDGFRLDMINESHTADLGMYSPSAEWKLVGAPAERNVLMYFCCPEPYPDVTYTIIIKRRSLFYMMNLILPLVIITLLINVSFVLPAESGERVSLVITILLSMTVYMMVVANTIPPTSDSIPLIGKFYMAGMCEMAVGLIWTCYILKYYHSDVIRMPRWVRKYILEYMGGFFGIKMEHLTRVSEHSRHRKRVGHPEENEHSQFDFSPMTLLSNRRSSVNSEVGEPYTPHKRQAKKQNPYSHNPYSQVPNGVSLRVSLSADTAMHRLRLPSVGNQVLIGEPAVDIGQRILERVSSLVENSAVDDRIQLHREEWRIVAMVMDKVSLWVFAIMVLATILACFLQAPGERISLTITILLAMTVFMMVVADTIPPTSDSVPLIGKFYMAGMCEMAVGLIWTCYILKYYHSDVIKMPNWVRKYILGYMGNFFGIKMENLTRVSEHSRHRNRVGRPEGNELNEFDFSPAALLNNHNSSINSDVGEPYSPCKRQAKRRHPYSQVPNGIPLTNTFVTDSALHDSNMSVGNRVVVGEPAVELGQRILERVSTLVENSAVDDRINLHKEEWRIAAMVMDKVSLWVFSITVLVTVLACFLQAPEYIS